MVDQQRFLCLGDDDDLLDHIPALLGGNVEGSGLGEVLIVKQKLDTEGQVGLYVIGNESSIKAGIHRKVVVNQLCDGRGNVFCFGCHDDLLQYQGRIDGRDKGEGVDFGGGDEGHWLRDER